MQRPEISSLVFIESEFFKRYSNLIFPFLTPGSAVKDWSPNCHMAHSWVPVFFDQSEEVLAKNDRAAAHWHWPVEMLIVLSYKVVTEDDKLQRLFLYQPLASIYLF